MKLLKILCVWEGFTLKMWHSNTFRLQTWLQLQGKKKKKPMRDPWYITQKHTPRTAAHRWQHSSKRKQPPAVWFAFMWLFTSRTSAAKIKNTHRRKKTWQISSTAVGKSKPRYILMASIQKCTITCLMLKDSGQGQAVSLRFNDVWSCSFML